MSDVKYEEIGIFAIEKKLPYENKSCCYIMFNWIMK